MLVNKGFKFRIKPNKEQMVLIEKTFGCTRFVFNLCLDKSIKMYKEEKVTLRYKDYASMLVEIKKEYEFTFECNISDINAIKGKLRDAVSHFVYEQTKRSPMILPIIMEV